MLDESDDTISVKRIYDQNLIKALYKDCFDEVKDDSIGDYESWIPNTSSGMVWVSISKNDKIAGIALFEQRFSNLYECHVHILKEARGKDSYNLGKCALQFARMILNNPRFLVTIPLSKPHVIRYAEKCGFRNVARLAKCTCKNGIYSDIQIMESE